MRNENEILTAASTLLRDSSRVCWTEAHLAMLFSLGLTEFKLDRADTYDEHTANRLLLFVIKHANGVVMDEELVKGDSHEAAL
jgi:hypothetical protein